MTDSRILNLEGVHNFRDFGGYAIAGGGRLKMGLLWRSGQHYGASDADLAVIDALGLVSVFDLRSSREREAHPCRRPNDFAATVHFAKDPSRQLAPHVAAAAATRKRSAAETREGMLRNYTTIAFRPELQEMTRLYFAELAAGKGPSLINCMAGKDRTGIVVALLQLACGVHRDDVIADYLLTNTAGDAEARIAAGAESIKSVSGTTDMEVIRALMAVEAAWLENAFAAIAEKHGSIDAFLTLELGADAALRERLRGVLEEG